MSFNHFMLIAIHAYSVPNKHYKIYFNYNTYISSILLGSGVELSVIWKFNPCLYTCKNAPTILACGSNNYCK